ncbi:MAG: FecR family protein [Sphingobacterium sp.]|jgi:hypothetical protein|nr:FecR family protein [Sphingobacterium sp.]
MNANQEFEDLFTLLANGTITKPQLDRLISLIKQHDFDQELVHRLKLELEQPTLLQESALVDSIASRARANIMERTAVRTKTRRFPRPVIWWAASILLVSGLTVQYFKQLDTVVPTEERGAYGAVQDIAPGGNNAVLTLSNGKTFVLDSTEQQLVSQDGAIGYDGGKDLLTLKDSVYQLTLATPRRGQYQALLPDGTRVWLNAESKISYPSRFDRDNRVVSVEGEAYFEVAKRQEAKFIVQLEGGCQVEVLGTHFNINAYSNFSDIKTTLLEGSVRVVSPDRAQVMLRPNEQAAQKRNGNAIHVNKVNVDDIVAWKNNKFNFDGLRFEEIMSQIERWYDIEVEYKNEVPKVEFYGEIGRQNTLLYVLKVFENSGIKLQLKGNKLLVY